MKYNKITNNNNNNNILVIYYLFIVFILYYFLIEDKKAQQDIETNIWSIFKTLIFAYTAILKAVAVDVLEGQGLIDVPHAGNDLYIILIFA